MIKSKTGAGDAPTAQTSPSLSFIICTVDSDYSESWMRVTTSLELDRMSQDVLCDTLQDVMIIGQDDRVTITRENLIESVTL